MGAHLPAPGTPQLSPTPPPGNLENGKLGIISCHSTIWPIKRPPGRCRLRELGRCLSPSFGSQGEGRCECQCTALSPSPSDNLFQPKNLRSQSSQGSAGRQTRGQPKNRGWPGPLAGAVRTGPLQALHLSCHLSTTHPPICIHLSNTNNPPGGEKFLIQTVALNIRRKVTGPHSRPDPWAFAQALPPDPGPSHPMQPCVCTRPVCAPDLSFKASSHPTSLASPAQRLWSRAAWSVPGAMEGGLPGLRIWSPLRGKSARMTMQSKRSAAGRQMYPRDAGSSKDRCLHWGLVHILVLTPL